MTSRVLLYWPNVIGYVRICLLFGAWAFYESPSAFLPLYSSSILLDAVDGWVARRLQQVSRFGAWLDVVIDNLSRGMIWTQVCQVWVFPPPRERAEKTKKQNVLSFSGLSLSAGFYGETREREEIISGLLLWSLSEVSPWSHQSVLVLCTRWAGWSRLWSGVCSFVTTAREESTGRTASAPAPGSSRPSCPTVPETPSFRMNQLFPLFGLSLWSHYDVVLRVPLSSRSPRGLWSSSSPSLVLLPSAPCVSASVLDPASGLWSPAAWTRARLSR